MFFFQHTLFTKNSLESEMLKDDLYANISQTQLAIATKINFLMITDNCNRNDLHSMGPKQYFLNINQYHIIIKLDIKNL